MKKIIIIIVGVVILFGGFFFFRGSHQSNQTQEQTVLETALTISHEYVALRYQTDNVLAHAKDYGDYTAWKNEMSLIIQKWGELEKDAATLEKLSEELSEEKVSFKFTNQALAYTKEEITNIVDRAPVGKKIMTLAKHLGVDAKMAQLILNQSQDEMSSEAYTEEGDVFQKCENRATVVKNSCKVSVFVGTIVLTGGTAAIATSGTLAQAAVVVSGADLTLEITDDAAKMALGDKNKISSIVGDARVITEPAAAILMVSTLPSNMIKGIDKLNAVIFGADQLNGTIQSGSVIGIKLPTPTKEKPEPATEVSILEKGEVEKWVSEQGGHASITEEDMKNLLIELGLSNVVEEAAKPKFSIDGKWVGSLTYEKFTPSPESAGNDLVCQSSAGLPATVPITIQATTYPDVPADIINAVVNIAGGAACHIYPDGWDKFSSSWEKIDTDVFSLLGGGPLILTKNTVSIVLPNGYSFFGNISADGSTISGEASQNRSGGGADGSLFFHWTVARE